MTLYAPRMHSDLVALQHTSLRILQTATKSRNSYIQEICIQSKTARTCKSSCQRFQLLAQGQGAARRTSAHGGEHAQGGAGNAVHVGQREADVDADGDHEAGNDGGLVAQRKAEDNVSGSASAARVSHILPLHEKTSVHRARLCLTTATHPERHSEDTKKWLPAHILVNLLVTASPLLFIQQDLHQMSMSRCSVFSPRGLLPCECYIGHVQKEESSLMHTSPAVPVAHNHHGGQGLKERGPIERK